MICLLIVTVPQLTLCTPPLKLFLQIANEMKCHLSDVQRELMRLKAHRMISIEWSDKSICFQVENIPYDLDMVTVSIHKHMSLSIFYHHC